MALHTRRLLGTTITLRCDREADPVAEWLLDRILPGVPAAEVAPGKRLEMGWTVLFFVPTEAGLALWEPDFDTDPNRLRADTTRSLVTLAEQTDVVRRVGAQPVKTRFDDQVLAVRGFEGHRELLLQRAEPQASVSGWSITPLEMEPPDDPAAWMSFVSCGLVRLRPSILPVLTLPPGYLVVFDGDTIKGIADPDNNEVWAR